MSVAGALAWCSAKAKRKIARWVRTRGLKFVSNETRIYTARGASCLFVYSKSEFCSESSAWLTGRLGGGRHACAEIHSSSFSTASRGFPEPGPLNGPPCAGTMRSSWGSCEETRERGSAKRPGYFKARYNSWGPRIRIGFVPPPESLGSPSRNAEPRKNPDPNERRSHI